jgi:hypothetical protein
MGSILPTKILTVEDCELRIKDTLIKLENPDLFESEILRLETEIEIWEYMRDKILVGDIITFDSSEVFGCWPAQV